MRSNGPARPNSLASGWPPLWLSAWSAFRFPVRTADEQWGRPEATAGKWTRRGVIRGRRSRGGPTPRARAPPGCTNPNARPVLTRTLDLRSDLACGNPWSRPIFG